MDMKSMGISSPQIGTTRRICTGPAQKGLMQRFIKTRAKSWTDANNNQSFNTKGNPIISDALKLNPKGNPVAFKADNTLHYHESIYSRKPVSLPNSPRIERDEHGKPIRRGFIPAAEKIKKELMDFKKRESELRRSRRSLSLTSQPDLVASIKDQEKTNNQLNQSFASSSLIQSSISMSSEFSDSLDSVFSEISEISSLNLSFDYHKIHKLPGRRSLPANTKISYKETKNDFQMTNSEIKNNLPLEMQDNKIIEENEEENGDNEGEIELMSSKKMIEKWENLIKENSKK